MYVHIPRKKIRRTLSTGSDDEECENFEFGKTQNDWMKIAQKINLIFLISNIFGLVSDERPFWRYESNSVIGGVSFEDISKTA